MTAKSDSNTGFFSESSFEPLASRSDLPNVAVGLNPRTALRNTLVASATNELFWKAIDIFLPIYNSQSPNYQFFNSSISSLNSIARLFRAPNVWAKARGLCV